MDEIKHLITCGNPFIDKPIDGGDDDDDDDVDIPSEVEVMKWSVQTLIDNRKRP
jgi:hypothetical protein